MYVCCCTVILEKWLIFLEPAWVRTNALHPQTLYVINDTESADEKNSKQNCKTARMLKSPYLFYKTDTMLKIPYLFI